MDQTLKSCTLNAAVACHSINSLQTNSTISLSCAWLAVRESEGGEEPWDT
jgi:hypothetical protein